MIPQWSPFSCSHLGKIPVNPDQDELPGLNYQLVILQILSTAEAAPVAGGESFTYAQSRNKLADGSGMGLISKKSLEILQRLYCP